MEKETLLKTTWCEHGYKLYLILRKEGLDIRFVDVDAFVGRKRPTTFIGRQVTASRVTLLATARTASGLQISLT
jgi:hypothetical protein